MLTPSGRERESRKRVQSNATKRHDVTFFFSFSSPLPLLHRPALESCSQEQSTSNRGKRLLFARGEAATPFYGSSRAPLFSGTLSAAPPTNRTAHEAIHQEAVNEVHQSAPSALRSHQKGNGVLLVVLGMTVLNASASASSNRIVNLTTLLCLRAAYLPWREG